MEAKKEKKLVALSSVFAAILLTAFKLIVGIVTGSLGILSEALHSGLDMVAAVMTYFAVKIADKPADSKHQFGHGKVENLSALFETLLLLITCVWIIYEAVDRLTTGTVLIKVNFWSFFVVTLSIIVDISRSRALSKAAKKYNSQALEADALHFSSDIFSSAVVLVGLVGVLLNFHAADTIAALIVAAIVIYISIRLGKRAIDALIDSSPQELHDKVQLILDTFPEIRLAHDIRLRTSGAEVFIDMNIHVNPCLTIEEAHNISDKIEEQIMDKIKYSRVHIHIEPDEV
ncbi:MAG: Cation transporter [Bacteroidota bacterium]|nr:Cation transporter [Bacteroidota bacterium]